VSHRLNLARRPFVNTRPVNIIAAILGIATIGLTVISFQTVEEYLSGSQKTREAIAQVRREIATLEAQRDAADRALQKHDFAEIVASSEEARSIARRRTFSWTRFLSRLETTLPEDVRVSAIALAREQAGERKGGEDSLSDMRVTLVLIGKQPELLPKVIRAFYDSPYFDRPVPFTEVSARDGKPEGTEMNLSVTYRDAGKAP